MLPITPIKRKANNFDVLRILFAWFVIISHSYVLNGANNCDILCRWSNHFINFSYVGVKGFFVISGYLIFQSLMRSQNAFDYLWKRVLRIYPALIVLLLVTIGCVYFIYKPIYPAFSFRSEAISYFFKNLLLFTNQWRIHGVFDNIASTAINGSLWTIGYEFFFYIVLLLFYPIRKNIPAIRVLLVLIIVLFSVGNLFYLDFLTKTHFLLKMDFIFDLGGFFLMGALFASFDWDNLSSKKLILAVSLILMTLVLYFKLNHAFICLGLSFIILFIGKQETGIASFVHKRLGDPSYGIYLYAFPLQQFLVYLHKPSTVQLLWASTFGAVVLGLASWHLVEKKALKYKNLLITRPT